jgi:hypothetical protein
MSADKIVVLAMAIAFFGGLAFLFWKNRHSEQKAGQASSSRTSDIIGEDSSKRPQEKERKSSKS